MATVLLRFMLMDVMMMMMKEALLLEGSILRSSTSDPFLPTRTGAMLIIL